MLTNGCFTARSTILSGNFQKTVCVHLKSGDQLGLSTGHWRNTSKLKLSKKTVVTALSTFTLIADESLAMSIKVQKTTKHYSLHRESDGGLVVLDRCECSRLVSRNWCVTGHNDTKDIALHGNAERKGSNIEKEEIFGLVRGLSSEDGSLDSSAIGNGLIRVNRLVQLTTTEVFRDEGLNLGDTSRSTDKNDIVNLFTRHFGIFQDLLDGLERGLEHGSIDLLKTSTSDVC